MTGTFGYGQMTPFDTNHETNATAFFIRQMMAHMETMRLVEVKTFTAGSGDPPAPGTVDVLPLVNQIDGNGNGVAHGVVHGIPVWRLQGGAAGIICEPKVGDVGYVVVSNRDISAVKASRKRSNPGSWRQFDLADGVYVGGVLNAAPTDYIRFKPDGGLRIVDRFGNVVETFNSGITVTPAGGIVTIEGALRVTGGIIAGYGGVDQVGLQTHLHTSGGSGSPTSAPTAGS